MCIINNYEAENLDNSSLDKTQKTVILHFILGWGSSWGSWWARNGGSGKIRTLLILFLLLLLLGIGVSGLVWKAKLIIRMASRISRYVLPGSFKNEASGHLHRRYHGQNYSPNYSWFQNMMGMIWPNTFGYEFRRWSTSTLSPSGNCLLWRRRISWFSFTSSDRGLALAPSCRLLVPSWGTHGVIGV